ncbi:MAG: glutamine amidotransferase [Candidatus Limnocylindria bacterium]
MNRSLNIMLVGESWFTYSIHQKGFDTFQTADYTEGATEFIAGLERLGHRVRYIPAHRVDTDFPADAGEFAGIDAVILSDVGANTFLLTKKTFNESKIVPNRLEALRSYVLGGGGLLMVGGYMSFAGIDGKARYGSSPLADVLPVSVKDHDDRVEVPEGFVATVLDARHPALVAVSGPWPRLLGYNQVVARDDSIVLVSRGDDPILAVTTFGSGRSAAFTPDLAPHWAPPEFVAWEAYPQLWDSLLRWLAQDVT